MWHASKHEVSEGQIADEHWRVLKNAAASADEFPVGREDVRAALDYFRQKVNRAGGLNLLCAGIEENRRDKMIESLALRREHLGR